MALRKALKEFMEMPLHGDVAEWLRSGLQNRLPRFNSGRGLQPSLLRSFGLASLQALVRRLPRRSAGH